jgi:tetratricopeptide (TPR) repeat protein
LERRAVVQATQSGDTRETLRAIYDETREFYPDDSPVLAITAMAYGKSLFSDGEHETAEPYLREAVRRFRASTKPLGVYFVAAGEALFQVVRGRDDPASVREADDLLRDMIKVGRTFWGADALATTQRYYATRMADRGRFGDALDAMLDGHQALVDANRSEDERENLRDNLTNLAFQVAVRPDLEPEVYARAREAVDRALLEEPDHAAMIMVQGAVLYRQGEFVLAAETLDRLQEPLTKSRGSLARKIAPADHAFRALVHARLGDAAIARAELETLRARLGGRAPRPGSAAVGGSNGDDLFREVVRVVEALREPTPSSTEDR